MTKLKLPSKATVGLAFKAAGVQTGILIRFPWIGLLLLPDLSAHILMRFCERKSVIWSACASAFTSVASNQSFSPGAESGEQIAVLNFKSLVLIGCFFKFLIPILTSVYSNNSRTMHIYIVPHSRSH